MSLTLSSLLLISPRTLNLFIDCGSIHVIRMNAERCSRLIVIFSTVHHCTGSGNQFINLVDIRVFLWLRLNTYLETTQVPSPLHLFLACTWDKRGCAEPEPVDCW